MRTRAWTVAVLVAMAAAGGMGGAVRADALDDNLAAARALLEAGKQDEAMEKLMALQRDAQSAVVEKADDAHANYILGAASMYLGDDAIAARSLLLATRLEPKNAEYLLAYGTLSIYREKWADAQAQIKQAMDLGSKAPSTWALLGDAQAGAGKFDEAQKSYEEAAKLSPKEPRYQVRVADCLSSQGKKEEAIAAYEKAVELAPSDWRSLTKIVQLDEALGKNAERDAAREKILALWKAKKISDPAYCRDQFPDGKEKVMVFEYFDTSGDTASIFAFAVVEADGKTIARKIELTATAAGGGPRTFVLTAEAGGKGEVLSRFPAMPSYDEAKKLVSDYLKGAPAASGPAKDAP